MRFQVAGPTAFAVGLGVFFVSACTPMVKKSAKSETPPVAREVVTPTPVPTVPPPAMHVPTVAVCCCQKLLLLPNPVPLAKPEFK